VLFSPGKLKSFLDAATKSMTLDKATHLTDLYSLATRMRHLDAAHVDFVTAPIANRDYTPPGQSSGGRVLLDDVAGKVLWQSIIDDNTSMVEAGAQSTSTAPPTATPTHPKSPSPLTVAPRTSR